MFPVRQRLTFGLCAGPAFFRYSTIENMAIGQASFNRWGYYVLGSAKLSLDHAGRFYIGSTPKFLGTNGQSIGRFLSLAASSEYDSDSSVSLSVSGAGADCSLSSLPQSPRAASRCRCAHGLSSAGRRPVSTSREDSSERLPAAIAGCRRQCLLNRVFGGGEVAEASDSCSEHLRREFAQQAFDLVIY